MTIIPAVLQAAIVERLAETFPGEPVYEDVTPRDFERPSNMVELAAISLDPQSMGRAVVSIQYKYKITTFCTVDEVHDSHLPTLDLRAMMILGAFAQGYLKAADRALKVAALAADTSLYDSAEVTLTLSLTVDRAEFSSEELRPIMQDLTVRYIKKEERSHE